MNFISLVCAFLCVVLFGSNYVIIKGAVAHIPPLLLSSMRLLVLGGIMAWFVPMPKKNTLNKLILLSMTQFSINYGLCTMGINETNAGIAAILTQLEVPFAIILGFLFLKEKLTWQQAAGCMLAFLGSLLIIDLKLANAETLGMLMIIVAGLVYAISCFQVRSLTELNAGTITAWCSLLAAAQLLLISMSYEHISMADVQACYHYFSYIALAAATSGVAFVLWTRLIKAHPVSQVMPIALLIPFVGVTAGIIFLDEALTIKIAMGGIITTLGVALILIKENIFKRRLTTEIVNAE